MTQGFDIAAAAAQRGAQPTAGDSQGAVAAPERTRAMDVASFEQLLSQAQEQQAHVEFTNSADGKVKQSIDGVTRVIGATSNDYVSSVETSRAAVAKIDFKSPQTIVAAFDGLAAAAVSGAQLTVMLGEVTSSKKSLTELFHNQG
jgi:hypothetical protein